MSITIGVRCERVQCYFWRKRLLRFVYRVFISLLDARVFASMFSKLSSKLYRNVLVERLSSHIDTELGEKFTWLINHTASGKSLKERCTAQIIVVNDFYDCLATMRQLNHKPKLKFESIIFLFLIRIRISRYIWCYNFL